MGGQPPEEGPNSHEHDRAHPEGNPIREIHSRSLMSSMRIRMRRSKRQMPTIITSVTSAPTPAKPSRRNVWSPSSRPVDPPVTATVTSTVVFSTSVSYLIRSAALSAIQLPHRVRLYHVP